MQKCVFEVEEDAHWGSKRKVDVIDEAMTRCTGK